MKKRFIVTLILLTCHLSLVTSRVHAQSATMSVSPPVVEMLLAPNKKLTQTFNFHLQGSGLSVIPELHLAKPSDADGHMYVDPTPLNRSSIPLVVGMVSHVFGEPIEMQGEDLSLTLTFEAANLDIPEDVYLALVLSAVSTSSLSSSTTTTPAISSLILASINPTGVMPINLEVKNYTFPTFHDSWLPLSTAPTIENKIALMIRPTGTFEIIGPSGKNVLTIPLVPNLILGSSSRNISGLTWSPSWRDFGPHSLRLTLTTQGGTKITVLEKVVWILPIRLTLAIIAIASVLLTLIYKQSRLKIV